MAAKMKEEAQLTVAHLVKAQKKMADSLALAKPAAKSSAGVMKSKRQLERGNQYQHRIENVSIFSEK
jgi:hypothetical protein